MNSEEGVLLFIFIVAVMNSVHCVSGQHTPLYIAQSSRSRDYILIYDVRYDKEGKQLVVSETNYGGWVSVACPRNNDPTTLEIRIKVLQANFSPQCEIPVESRIIEPRPRYQYLPNVIGFLVFIPNVPSIRDYSGVPPNHELIDLIRFKFDETLCRVRMVNYHLGAGKFLKPEISTENNIEEYQKDDQLFGYNVDLLYSQTELPVVKVLLAPEGDFYFDNWKSASRHNIITAPMWNDCLAQWQALETFIRKVAQIVDSVNISAGVYDTLTSQSTPDLSPQKIYLHDEKHPIPKYFWKSVYVETRLEDYSNRIYGVLFVMHNGDLNTELREKPICPEDADVMTTHGWQFLPDDDVQLKTSIYACKFNAATLKSFPEAIVDLHFLIEYDFASLDLRGVPVRRFNDEGRKTDTVRLNVLEEMKLKVAKDELFDKNNREKSTRG